MGSLTDLIKVIETIRRRINEHHSSLAGNETRTRQALIDPLLTALGWDVADPDLVTLEYVAGGGRADYALLGSGGPVAVVEAKKLRRTLHDNDTNQALNYANRQGINYMAVTNGDEWTLYDVFKRAPLDERMLMQLKISERPPHESAIQSLRLWNPNLSSGAESVVPVPSIVMPTAPTDTPVTPPPVTDADGQWFALDDERLLNKWRNKTGRMKKLVRFNKEQEILVRRWADMIKDAVEYLLVKPGKLTSAHCPRYLGNNKTKYFLNTAPKHENGNPFGSSRVLSNGMHLNTTIQLGQMIRNLCSLLQECGVDPAVVEVSLQPKTK